MHTNHSTGQNTKVNRESVWAHLVDRSRMSSPRPRIGYRRQKKLWNEFFMRAVQRVVSPGRKQSDNDAPSPCAAAAAALCRFSSVRALFSLPSRPRGARSIDRDRRAVSIGIKERLILGDWGAGPIWESQGLAGQAYVCASCDKRAQHEKYTRHWPKIGGPLEFGGPVRSHSPHRPLDGPV